jgi:hypothetical protein
MTANDIDPEVLARRIAGIALCHPDTAKKFVRGEPVRGVRLQQQLTEAHARILREHAEQQQPLQQTGT